VSVQRFQTAVIIEAEVQAEDDFFIVVGKAGMKTKDGGWQYTGRNYRLSAHTDFESAYQRYKKLWDSIRRNGGCVPKTVPRDLDTYLLP